MKPIFIRASASAAAIAAALAVSAPALAQDTAPPQEASEDTSEIIVTATLRNENLQDVPIAVTAFSGESLEKAGVRDVKNFESVAASFNTNSTQSESGGTTLRVRGVGTTGNNTGLESAVGIFLDGVYLSRPGVALGDLLDVQQVELLRGPQGTLFGRNTSAGAVSIKTAKPNTINSKVSLSQPMAITIWSTFRRAFPRRLPKARPVFAFRVPGATEMVLSAMPMAARAMTAIAISSVDNFIMNPTTTSASA